MPWTVYLCPAGQCKYALYNLCFLTQTIDSQELSNFYGGQTQLKFSSEFKLELLISEAEVREKIPVGGKLM